MMPVGVLADCWVGCALLQGEAELPTTFFSTSSARLGGGVRQRQGAGERYGVKVTAVAPELALRLSGAQGMPWLFSCRGAQGMQQLAPRLLGAQCRACQCCGTGVQGWPPPVVQVDLRYRYGLVRYDLTRSIFAKAVVKFLLNFDQVKFR